MNRDTIDDATTYRARCVLTVDRPPLLGGHVTTQANRIVSISQHADGPVEDLGDVILFPAPLNAHTHLEFSDLESPIGEPGMDFTQWIPAVVGKRNSAQQSGHGIDKQKAIRRGLEECARLGVAAVGEIATTPFAYDVMPTDPNVVAFLECISLADGGSENLLPRLDAHSEWADRYPDLIAGISPHAPYTVHPDTVTRLCDYARQHNRPVAMHLAETEQELELLATGGGPMRTMLESFGVWNPGAFAHPRSAQFYLERLQVAVRALVVHGNYLTAEQLAWIGMHRDRISLVYCPRTHQFFRHADYPLQEALRVGVRVVLGTDSRASSPDLSIWSEAVNCYHNHADVAPEEIVRMVTADAAAALGFAGQLGRLEPGYDACLVSVASAESLADPWRSLLEADRATLRPVRIAQNG